MTDRPTRIVDAHVHLWDPARTDWYPYLSGRQQLDLGDVTGMARRFDVGTYLAESSGWNVQKLVNVAAATGVHSIEETLELERSAEADGHPDVLIGGVTPTESGTEAVAQIDRQMGASRFRGVRPMGQFAGPLPATEVLGALQERGLVFELMAHPDQLREAARGLAPFGDLVVDEAVDRREPRGRSHHRRLLRRPEPRARGTPGGCGSRRHAIRPPHAPRRSPDSPRPALLPVWYRCRRTDRGQPRRSGTPA